jgi:hypothetical protein
MGVGKGRIGDPGEAGNPTAVVVKVAKSTANKAEIIIRLDDPTDPFMARQRTPCRRPFPE